VSSMVNLADLLFVWKKVNSECVVENVLLRCGRAFVRNVGNKKYNKYKESTLRKGM
ncbi:hypothetical protein Tco_0673992, partial [Tanacetum coccineum]